MMNRQELTALGTREATETAAELLRLADAIYPAQTRYLPDVDLDLAARTVENLNLEMNAIAGEAFAAYDAACEAGDERGALKTYRHQCRKAAARAVRTIAPCTSGAERLMGDRPERKLCVSADRI